MALTCVIKNPMDQLIPLFLVADIYVQTIKTGLKVDKL